MNYVGYLTSISIQIENTELLVTLKERESFMKTFEIIGAGFSSYYYLCDFLTEYVILLVDLMITQLNIRYFYILTKEVKFSRMEVIFLF